MNSFFSSRLKMSAFAALTFMMVFGSPQLVLCAQSSSSEPANVRTSELKLPPYKKITLPNGLTVLLMERHNLPLIDFSIMVNAGSVADLPNLEGTAELTAELLRKGTETRSAAQYASSIDSLGGVSRGRVDYDNSVFTSEFMKKDIDKGMELIADSLLHPVFPDEEVKKVRARHIDDIRSAKDQARMVVRTYFNCYLMGQHPYGRPIKGDENSLPKISREDIVKFYKANYTPKNTIVAVTGDFATDDMEKRLAGLFGNWQGEKTKALSGDGLLHPPPVKGRHLILVDKPDSTQTYFAIGNIEISRTNPDRDKVKLVNTIFGQRFTSMLNSALRIKSGLTYGAGSSFSQLKCDGPFVISTYTRNETTEKAIDMALDVLKQLHDKGLTEEQLISAKEYIKGQTPSDLETYEQLASTMAEIEFYGLDRHDVDDFFAHVDATSLADTRKIIDKYFPLNDLSFVVIGKGSEIGTIVKKYADHIDQANISDKGFSPLKR